MKVLRFYEQRQGRLVQCSVLCPTDDDEELETPRQFGKVSMNIDPLRSVRPGIKGKYPEKLVAEFDSMTPFLVRVDEIKHYIQVIDAMFNDKP